MLKLFLLLYSALWRLALPVCRRMPRLADGWDERTLASLPDGADRGFDLWIQSASGGESLVSAMVLAALADTLPKENSSNRPLRVLATSTTREGINTLEKIVPTPEMTLHIRLFPFDTPDGTRRAFAVFRPRLAVLVETELWPAWLIAAKTAQVPVLLINGRLSAKSCRRYRRLSRFFTTFGPDRVLAMSAEDAARFAAILPAERIRTVNNIKFDRMQFVETAPPFNFTPPAPFVVLGSVRREEEKLLPACLARLRARRPQATVAVFPKHPGRAAEIVRLLAARGFSPRLRSTLGNGCDPGTLIVWDSFGELAASFSAADAVFIGGSLCSWGGHNFLEPLAFGVRPLIGRNWKNFAWIGREVITAGLVDEIEDENELAERLLDRLDHPDDRRSVQARATALFAEKRGGTAATCEEIRTLLSTSARNRHE